MQSRSSLLALSLTACSFWITPASAQGPWDPESPPAVIEDRLRVELMAFGASVDTDLRLDPAAGDPGTVVDAEDELGLDDFAALAQAELTLLPGKRHFLRISALSLRRNGFAELEREIVFGDEIFPPGEAVNSTLDLAMVGLTYGYRFVLQQRASVAASFGVHITEVEASLASRDRFARESESGVAPLPLLGLEGVYHFNRRWALEGRGQYLRVDVSDVKGSMLDLRVGALWHLNPHLAFGLGYRLFKVDAESESPGTPGRVDLTLQGPVLYAQGSL